MHTTKHKQRARRGATLIEAVIAIGIFAIIGVIFAQTFVLAASFMADARLREGAMAVAMQQMEQLRNLPYDAVAVVGGVPSGTIPADQTVTLGSRTYSVHTDVRYVDDPDDGTAGGIPADTVPTDYKIVRIDVTWGDASEHRRVRLAAQFVPPGVESAAGGGTLVINVFDAEGAPLADATVTVTNTTTSPAIDVTTWSDASGRVVVPGAPAASHYAITVAKSGYETVSTLPPYPESSFHPTYEHATVTEGGLVAQSLRSSALSDVVLQVRDPFGAVIDSAALTITGGRVLGTTPSGDDVYNFTTTATTNTQGRITLAGREAGTYTITPATSAYAVLVVDDTATTQKNTFRLAQGTTPTVAVTLADTTLPGIIAVVKDATGTVVAGATARLQNAGGYDATATTNQYGEAFFPVTQSAPLTDNTDYTLTVTKQGYAPASKVVTVHALTTTPVTLIAQ